MATQLVPDWQWATWRKEREEGETGVKLLPEAGDDGRREIQSGQRDQEARGREGKPAITGTRETAGVSWGEPGDTARVSWRRLGRCDKPEVRRQSDWIWGDKGG